MNYFQEGNAGVILTYPARRAGPAILIRLPRRRDNQWFG